jgi:short-subunit dehydrogenase
MTSRLAVVTGASRGIGRARTEHLTAAAQQVAVIGRSPSDLHEVAGRTGAVPFVLDVADPVAVDEVVITTAYMASEAAVNRFTEAVAGECYQAGVRVFDTWTPVERVLDLVDDLDSGLLDALPGRYFRAAVDDWQDLARRADEVISLDTNIMRLTEPH